MLRLRSLPVLLCRLLCLIGAAVSASAAWLMWLGSHSPTIQTLDSLGTAASTLSLPAAPYSLALADLDPDREEKHLRAALAADPRNLAALLRLALLVEFAGDPAQAEKLLDQATFFHHSYKSYMAALTQASRAGSKLRMAQFATQALRFCPRDADGVYAQFPDLELARRVLASAGDARQADFLRYLLGQRRLADAQSYQATLNRSPQLDRYRLELCDLLFFNHEQESAAALFTRLHPEFSASGSFNTQLRSRPTSLAFDWRITEDKSARIDWRPGELDVDLNTRDTPLELLSIFIEASEAKHTKITPLWRGDTGGLSWQVATVAPGYKRVSLDAAPGPDRHFQLMEVRIE